MKSYSVLNVCKFLPPSSAESYTYGCADPNEGA